MTVMSQLYLGVSFVASFICISRAEVCRDFLNDCKGYSKSSPHANEIFTLLDLIF